MTAGDIQFVSNAGYGILTADSNRLISIQNGAFGVNGAATFSSTITTAAPSGGTAKPFKIGNVATVTPTSQNRTIEIEIDGTTYYLTAKTTNN
jgi:flagellar capping protein FliD